MAIAVPSTSINSVSDDDTVIVTAPTGIQVGDLLVIVAGGGGATAGGLEYPESTGFTASIQHQYDPGGGTSASHISLLYKIADSSDASATDYTVTFSARNSKFGAVAMLRITGWPSGNPIYHTAESGDYQDGNLTVNNAVSFPRASQQLIIMFGNTVTTSGEGGVFSFGTYQITSSDANPSWTEVTDAGYTASTGTIDGRFFCAYAITSNISTVTSYGFVKTGDSIANEETTAYAIGIIYDPVSATGSNALHSGDADFFTEASVVVGGVGSNALLSADADLFDPETEATHPTQWNSTNKPSTTWTPTNK